MANRFDKRGGFADMAAIQRKRSKTTPEKIDEIIDWRPIQKIIDQKLERKANTVGNPAYPALAMFKALLLKPWYQRRPHSSLDGRTPDEAYWSLPMAGLIEAAA